MRDDLPLGFEISRAQAENIATAHSGATIQHVRTVDEVRQARVREPMVYGVRLEGAWIAYQDLPRSGLRSSEIVVIDGRTGRVLYAGSARDEG